ncbi:MAG TPA: pyridoxamine 5'-phosphate oxidase family protein [Pseudomonadales bacterium]|nr:pyridoxamine 5'-phosphate oxidase family protein [Pseudomonadales bacterium]
MHDLVEQLLQQQNECTLSWVKSDNSPAATIVSFVWAEQSLWMTALVDSPRVRALLRRPRAVVTVSGKGTMLGESRCVSIQGRCVVRHEQEIRDWFFPAFAAAVLPASPKGQLMMTGAMQSPENLVLQFWPDRYIPFDNHALMRAANRL